MPLFTGERLRAFAQFARFLIVGGLVTAVGAAIYYFASQVLGWEPLIANLVAYVIGVVLGYVLHSQVSFRGHGQRATLRGAGGRFLAVNLVGLGANSFWVWSLVHLADRPAWWPIAPMVLITPPLTFLLHRRWTFRQSGQ